MDTVATVLLIAVIFVRVPPPTLPSLGDLDRQIDWDILEAVYRHQFSHNASGMQQRAEAYFLHYRFEEVSKEFIDRFQDCSKPVYALDEASGGIGGIVHRETQAKGLLLGVFRIDRVSRFHAIVRGGYYEGGLSSSENEYHLRLIAGRWYVVRDRLVAIS